LSVPEGDSSFNEESTQLFIAIVKPHKPVAPCTIARWLKEMLKLSGINVGIFTAHSTRSASVSAAAYSGVTVNDIQTGVVSQCSNSFTTILLMIHHMAELCCHQ